MIVTKYNFKEGEKVARLFGIDLSGIDFFVRLRKFPSFYQYFTVPEESLLAMGQYMFSHIAHSTAAKRDGRNALIVRYFLPNKEVSQIRLHMKNFRLSPEPIYTVIARAEQGMVTMIFPPEKSDSAQSGPPYLWRESIQPHWLQVFLQFLDCFTCVWNEKVVLSWRMMSVYAMLDKRVFHEPESTASDEVIRQDTASPDGLIIRQLPESGLTTPCHSSPTAVSETCEEGEDEAGMMEMSVIGRDHSERQQRTVSNTLAEEEKDRNERVKWSRGTEVDGNMMENMKGDEVLGRKGILELKAEHIRRKSELRKRKELSESPVKGCERKKHKELIRASEDGEDCSCAEQVGSESDGQVQKEANGSELQTVKDDQRGNISKPFELVNESSVNKKATERTELMHGKEAVQTNNGEVQNNRSDHIVCSSNESEIPAAQPANSASGMPAAFQVVQAAVPLSATSESLTSAFRAVDGSCSSVPPSCQVIFVPVMPNVSWIVLTQPSVGGQQILLGPSATQTVQTAGPVGENSINSDGTSAVGNTKGSVMSTLNAPDAVEVERSCEPRTEAANVVDVSDRSLDDRIVAAKGNTEETLVTSNTVQRNCIVEQGCTVSAVDDSVIVQAADVAESVDSNVEKNSLKSGTAASTGSLLECHPYSNTGAFQTEHDHKLLTEGSNICQTSPHSSQAILRTSEHIESAAKASTVVEDMPDVHAGIATEGDQCFTSDAIPQPITVQHLPFNSVTVSPVESAENSSFTFCAVSPAEKGQHSSCSFGAVSPAESSLVSPKSPMNNLLTLERDRGLSSPEDSNSGLTVLFTERSRTALNIHEGTPPPPTPSWQHSSGMAFIDDSASKTRFTG
ncbi:unnamed protein product [Toxocara canis]|uniref:HTH La-type RNA-binding domain-containing protein n=1 Tax=Toxocara canis TaxID=6265 RepID=A0A183TVC8_TOXCA|nr:unnamed protein product [Toxocara canis]